MAVDSIAERWSIMNMLAPWRGPVIPDNLISAGDRLHFLLLYSGIPAAEPAGASKATTYLIHSKAIAQNTIITDTSSNADLNIVGNTHFILAGSVKQIVFSIRIAGGTSVDLSGFTVEVKLTKLGKWIGMQKTWGAATDEDNFVLYSPDDLEGLTHDTAGMAILNTIGLWSIRFKSKFASVPGEAITRTLEIGAALDA